MRIPGSRRIGLQVWIGIATVAVGMLACLTLVLVMLPRLESSVRNDTALRDVAQLRERVLAAGPRLAENGSSLEFGQAVRDLSLELRADVRATARGLRASFPDQSRYLSQDDTLLSSLLESGAPQARIAEREDDVRVLVVAVPMFNGDGFPVGSIEAAAPAGDQAEIGLIRSRVFLAIAAVLVLASLAGYVIARMLGRRIAGLATAASELASGNLAARAPDVGPVELTTLSAGLNSMAGRLQGLVAEITHDRDRAEGLIARLQEGVVAVDAEGRVTLANAPARRYLGLQPDGPPEGTPPGDLMELVRTVLGPGGGRQAAGDMRVDGCELDVHVAAMPDSAAGAVVTLRDVTEDRKLARARRDLVANVSHELKTPLAAIKGFQELLSEGNLNDDDRVEFRSLMDQEIVRLERLIEEQLQLARLDSGAFPLNPEPFDLGELVEEVAAPRIVLAEREGVVMHVYAPSDGVSVTADPARVEQVLLILLDNALRHTAEGGRIRISVADTGDGPEVSVADDGEGIAAEDQPFIFDRFYRGDPSRVGHSAGLGLAIARGLAEAHGGTIELKSMEGVGSTFTLRLPPEPVLSGVTGDDRGESNG
jgi:two-component system sensor histidine kinase ResE